MKHVNYDEVSKTYDGRYKSGIVDGVEKAIRDLALSIPVKYALEVGCGTGAYLELFEKDVSTYGLDYSDGMLSKARRAYLRAKELDICPLRILEPMNEALGLGPRNETDT